MIPLRGISESAMTADSSAHSIHEAEAPSTSIENLRIGRTLGAGASCKVKIATDNAGNEFAMKILNRNKAFRKLIDAEVETLSMIKHPNIVNLIEHGEGIHGRSQKPFQYILLELVNGGCLFDYVKHSGRFEEKFARHYFR